jgi:hypothetical protein
MRAFEKVCRFIRSFIDTVQAKDFITKKKGLKINVLQYYPIIRQKIVNTSFICVSLERILSGLLQNV